MNFEKFYRTLNELDAWFERYDSEFLMCGLALTAIVILIGFLLEFIEEKREKYYDK